MLLILISWWYSDGIHRFFTMWTTRLTIIADFFSVGQLFRTLFNPFRQISNVNLRPDAPINVRFQAGFDKLISRFIGAFMRTLIIFVGLISLFFTLIIMVASIILFVLTPLLPILFVILFFVFSFGGAN